MGRWSDETLLPNPSAERWGFFWTDSNIYISFRSQHQFSEALFPGYPTGCYSYPYIFQIGAQAWFAFTVVMNLAHSHSALLITKKRNFFLVVRHPSWCAFSYAHFVGTSDLLLPRLIVSNRLELVMLLQVKINKMLIIISSRIACLL